jgi:hypothetical protein
MKLLDVFLPPPINIGIPGQHGLSQVVPAQALTKLVKIYDITIFYPFQIKTKKMELCTFKQEGYLLDSP